MPDSLKRILITGTTGSGKSTLARKMSGVMGVPHVELDALHWGPNWTPLATFKGDVQAAEAQESWIIEGGYVEVTAETWGKADLVIWLYLPFGRNLWCLLRRSLHRAWTQEPYYADNRETFRQTFASKESIILWLFKTYRKRGQECRALSLKHPHVPVKCFRSHKALEAFVNELEGGDDA